MKIKYLRRVMCVLLTVIMILPAVSAVPLETKAASTVVDITIENVTRKYRECASFLKLCNDYRAEKNLAAWEMDTELFDLAMKKAAELSVYTDENNLDGSSFLDNDKQNRGMLMGYGVSSNLSLLESFKTEPVYSSNLTSTTFNAAGVGVVEVNKLKYIVVFLAKKDVTPVDDSVLTQSNARVSEPTKCRADYLTECSLNVTDNALVECGRNFSIMFVVHNQKFDEAYAYISTSNFTITSSNKSIFKINSDDTILGLSPGIATITMTLNGASSIQASVKLKACGKSFARCTISGIPDQYYTGNAITPTVTITSSEGVSLVIGKDYKLSYVNNIKVGTAVIKISGMGVYADASATRSFQIINDPNTFSVSLKSNVSALELGQSAILTASVVNGTSPIKYKFESAPYGSSSFTTIMEESTENICSFKPSLAGTHNLKVTATDADNKVAIENMFISVSTPITINLNLNSTSLTLGNELTITVSATGGSSPYRFAYYVLEPGSTAYKDIAYFGSLQTLTYKPESAGSYQLRCDVKGSNDVIATISKSFVVNTSLNDSDFEYKKTSTGIGITGLKNKESVKEVVIPEYINEKKVTSIEDYAFSRCSSLTSVAIPNSVTSIGECAFEGCGSLTSLTIPDNVTNIGNYAFSRCTSLTSVAIPNSVTSIGNGAFYGCSSLTSVTIPSSVTTIGSRAFLECKGLTDGNGFVIVNGVLYDYYGDKTIIIIPSTVTSIGECAFEGCGSLTSLTILDNVTNIGNYAFSRCTSLTSVAIPNSVTSIGNGAFSNCNSLTSINIPDSVTSIGSSTFGGCTSLTSITIPSGVTSIGSSTFGGCTSLTSITIPSGVTSIEDYAFYECSSLTSITISSGVTSIGSYAFGGCSSLTSVAIPNSVTNIGNGAFSDCNSLTSINIPDSVTSIGSYAFGGCTSLASITIPFSVTSIDSGAFKGCSNLTSMIVPGIIEVSSCFDDPKSITNITISEGCTSIRESAFKGCSDLTSVTIPSSVTSIGNSAFSSCRSLTSITIPSGVTSIGDGAFYNCSSLKSIVVDDNNTGYSSVDGILYNKDKTELICCPGGKKTVNNIPSSVTSIGEGAFYNCSSLASITIPSGVTSIGEGAFYNCSSLVSVTISSSVKSIGEGAFYNCSSLASITIPSGVTSIGNSAFANCKIIKSITIPSGVTSIGDSAFAYCKSLTSIKIPFSVTSIGNYAFDCCSSLASITIPSSVTTIGYDAFGECSSLKSITIPSSVTSIGMQAFGYYYDKGYKIIDGFTIYGKAGSAAEIYANSNCLKFVAVKPLTNTSVINSDKVQIGDKVRISASANGGTAPYTYAYYYKRSTNAAWKTLGTEWGTNSSVAFAPTAEAIYDIKVIVKDSTGSTAEKLFTVTAIKELELTNVSVVGRINIKLGTAIPMIGKAVGGAGEPYTYSFYFKRSTNTNWKLLGDKFQTTASARFKPTATGTYDIRIDVKDNTGTIVKKFFTATVK